LGFRIERQFFFFGFTEFLGVCLGLLHGVSFLFELPPLFGLAFSFLNDFELGFGNRRDFHSILVFIGIAPLFGDTRHAFEHVFQSCLQGIGQ